MPRKSAWTLPKTIVAASLLGAFLFSFQATIVSGQVGKQTFSAEMARSYERGQTVHGFPIRHFPEVYHPKNVAWAEEFPLYTFSVGTLARWTGASVVIVGRLVSWIGFCVLLAGLYFLGSHFGGPTQGWLLAAIGACFPGFIIYASSVMPDLWMAACCVWMMAWVVRERWKEAWVWGMVACLFKYYAAFSVLGVALYGVIKTKKYIRFSFWAGTAVLPCVAYIAWFIAHKIPNPIVEYRNAAGGGHAGVSFLQNLKFYPRLVTWNVVKNPGVIAGLVGCYGLYEIVKRRKVFWISLLAANAAFMVVFCSAFFVHDYYGIQFAILMAFFTCTGLIFLSQKKWKYSRYTVSAGLAVFFLNGWHLSYYARYPQGFYQAPISALVTHTSSTEMGALISERTGEVPLFIIDRPAWLIRAQNFSGPWPMPWSIEKQNHLLTSEADWVGVFLIGDNPAHRYRELYQKKLQALHLKELSETCHEPKSGRDEWSCFWLLRKKI